MRKVSIVVCAVLLFLAALPAAAQERISRLGQYEGYSERRFDGFIRTSEYVAMRDGTRLAVDVIRPTLNGAVTEEKLPILYTHERYGRADMVNGKAVTQAGFQPMWSFWVSHGYIYATADSRGTGASFGTRNNELIDADSRDAYDVIEWLAAQPYSNGNVGMVGVSANAHSQWLAAGSAPPSLKAIMPQMSSFDLYGFVYFGGVYHQTFLRAWGESVKRLDQEVPPIPVDEDTDGAMARAAQAEHMANANIGDLSAAHAFRDSILPDGTTYANYSVNRFLAAINQSGIAVYQVSGWFDMWPRDQAQWFNNLTVPQRIVFAPTSHGSGFVANWQRYISQLTPEAFTNFTALNFQLIETLRFFDYHLKGIDNGIMDEPPIWYYTIGAPFGEAWRSSQTWPPAEAKYVPFYLTDSPKSDAGSINNGGLAAMAETTGEDSFTVNYEATTGPSTRWHNGHGGDFFYAPMNDQAKTSLTYDTAPLEAALEVTGSPIIRLQMAANTTDADIFVYLEEVDEAGVALYISEGVLRASHRKLSEPPFNNFGLPFHSGNQADTEPLTPGEKTLLVFDLLPTSNIFDAGHRIRIRVAGADKDSYGSLNVQPPPVITLFRGAEGSQIDLPIITR
jgi:uncharacterized protein